MHCAVAAARSPQPAKQYQPQVGQAGKDVVWVPTAQALVDKMLDMAKATPKRLRHRSRLGRWPHGDHGGQAGHQGPRHRVQRQTWSSWRSANAAKEGVADKATFVQADIFESDFSQATVLTLFLLTDLNIRLRPTILDMKPGTRVVSNSFGMGDWDAR